MKIQALLELIEPEVRNYQTDRKLKDKRFDVNRWRKDPSYLGYGNFSKVRSAKDPHTVRKTSVSTTTGDPRDDDAYWDFADLIIKNKLWENPYFPRFYKKTSLYGKDKTSHHDMEIERLERIDKAPDEELIPMIRKALTKEGRSQVKEQAKVMAEVGRGKGALINVFSTVLNTAVSNGDLSLIGDDELAKALKILNLYAKNSSVKVDIHEENIMARRTPVGLQLVISDPFSFKG